MLKLSIRLTTFVSYSRLYLYHFRNCTCTHCMTVPEQFYWLNLYPTNNIQLTLTYPFRGCTWTIFLTLPVPFPIPMTVPISFTWLFLYPFRGWTCTISVAIPVSSILSLHPVPICFLNSSVFGSRRGLSNPFTPILDRKHYVIEIFCF